MKVHIYWVFQGLIFLAQPQCSLHRDQSPALVRGLTFLPLLMNYLEFQIHFSQAGSLWWDLQNASLTIVQKPSLKKFVKATQKGQKWKYRFGPFQLKFFENICIFIILRYGFPFQISITELLRHIYFWPLCNGLQNTFLTDLAQQPLLRLVWSWKTILGYDLINWG